jgi:hypothetical protein
MPFTFAHPAIVLPFNYLPKKYVSLTALIAGSMAPDFEYFLRMKTLGLYGHTASGWLFFDLPMSLLLAFLFHLVIRNPLISHLPHFLEARLQPYTTFNWKRKFQQHWLVVIFSALVGTGSHLLWDGFTHSNGFFVELIPSLTSSVPILNAPVYKLLQHGGTLAGFVVIGWALWQLPFSDEPTQKKNVLYFWRAIIILTAVIVGIRMSLLPVFYIGDIVSTIVGACLWAMLAVCFLYNKLRPSGTVSK